MNRVSTALLLFLFAMTGKWVFAQAPIDPSLPPAPLSHRRVLILFPGFETVRNPRIPVPPLLSRQKFEMAYRKAFDPSFPIEAVVIAEADEVSGYGPQYGSGAGPFAQRIAYNAANLASGFFFTDALLPSMLHQDPRYFRKGNGTRKSRAWWAVHSAFVAFNDRGEEVPNYSSVIGLGMSTALSNAYLPTKSVTFGNTMERYGEREGISVGLNLLREFGDLGLPEKLRHLPPRGGRRNRWFDFNPEAD